MANQNDESGAPVSVHQRGAGQSSDIRVLCVDDSQDIATVLQMVVEAETGMCSVGLLNRADGLVDEAVRSSPDIVLLDLKMPGRNPLEALRDLSVRCPAVRVIVFSAFDDARAVEEATAAGAWGYLRKGCALPDIVQAIRSVAGGDRVASG